MQAGPIGSRALHPRTRATPARSFQADRNLPEGRRSSTCEGAINMIVKMWISGAFLALTAITTQAQNCTKGKRCGNACISVDKACHIGTGTTAAASPIAALGDVPAYAKARMPIADSVLSSVGDALRASIRRVLAFKINSGEARDQAFAGGDRAIREMLPTLASQRRRFDLDEVPTSVSRAHLQLKTAIDSAVATIERQAGLGAPCLGTVGYAVPRACDAVLAGGVPLMKACTNLQEVRDLVAEFLHSKGATIAAAPKVDCTEAPK